MVILMREQMCIQLWAWSKQVGQAYLGVGPAPDLRSSSARQSGLDRIQLSNR